jgi:type IV pilus assembly protein PilV
MKQTSVRRCQHAQAGFTLIEVLVAILICSFGLLGIVGLQARAMQYSVSAEDSNRAILLANEITAEMYSINMVTLPPAVITAWQDRVSAPPSAGGLPGGVGTIDIAGGVATVRVQWLPPGPTATRNQYVTQLSL